MTTNSMLLIAILSAASASGAAAEGELQVTRDRSTALISSDVGAERWAITFDPGRGSITGNVFTEDGAPPKFVDCDLLGITPEEFTFGCYGADSCTPEACGPDSWTYLRDVTLPKSFVLSPDESAPKAASTCPDLSGTWITLEPCGCNLCSSLYLQIEQDGCTFRGRNIQGTITGSTADLTIDFPVIPNRPPSDANCVARATGTGIITAESIHAILNWTSTCCETMAVAGFTAVRR